MVEYVTPDLVSTYENDGAVFLKGLFADWVEPLRAGVEHNMSEPGPHAAENLKEGEKGQVF